MNATYLEDYTQGTGYKYCVANYSLTNGDYCTADYQCASGFCYDGSDNISATKVLGKCASERPLTADPAKALITCDDVSDCSGSD
jgi:hypothetical protein